MSEQDFTVVKNKRDVTTKKNYTNKNNNYQKLENDVKNLQRKIYSPKVDLISSSDVFKVRIELPGVQKNKIQVELKEEQILLISGTRTSCIILNEETDKVIYSETKYGNFVRRVKLPDFVEPFYFNQNKCELIDGVLYLELKKKLKPNSTIIYDNNVDWSEM